VGVYKPALFFFKTMKVCEEGEWSKSKEEMLTP
jgi:hypothetical protein